MGKHRHASRKLIRLATLAGVVGSAITIPLIASTSASAASVSTWEKVAQCESGGNWSINTGNGYYGGLQFSASSWIAAGGGQYAVAANPAAQAQQIPLAGTPPAAQGAGGRAASRAPH